MVFSSPVDIRVSFNREVALPYGVAAAGGIAEGEVVYERRKRRRTWEAPLWRIALTHVTTAKEEACEVEVELRMEAVRPLLEASARQEEEALRITRELVAALRTMASWVAGVESAPSLRKRQRLEAVAAA